MVLPLQIPPIEAWFAEQGRLTALPWTAWRSDSRLVVFEGGDLKVVDPKTGGKTGLVAKKAFAAARKGAALSPPEAYSPSFGRLAYRFGKELAVYDVARRRFQKVDVGEVKSMAFSPDGTRLAYAKDRDLYVWTAATGRSARLTTADRPRLLNGVLSWVYWEEIMSRREIAFHWSPDSRRIAYLQTDESPVKESSFVDFDAVPPTVHKQAYPFAGTPNPKARVGVVSAAGGKTAWVRPGSYEYLSRFGWTPKGEVWALTLDRRISRSDLWLANPGTGAARRILGDRDPKWVNLTDDVRFLPDGKVLMNSPRDGFDLLYRWSREGKVLNPVTPPGRSLDKPLFATGGIQWVDPKGGSLLFVSGDPQRFEKQLYRVGIGGGAAVQVTKEPGSHYVSVSPDGQAFVDLQHSLDQPPRSVLRRTDGNTVAVLFERKPLPTGKLEYRPAQMLRVPARDGFPLPAYVRLPVGYEPGKKYPAMVYVYGGPGLPQVADAWHGITDQLFTSAGYVLFVVDPRSATLLNEKLARSVKGHASGVAQARDLEDAARWLKRQPYVDPARVGLWGWSGGGTFTLSGLTRTKEFAAGVSVAPVSDWRYYDTVYTETLMGLPAENPKGYAEAAQWRNAKNLHGRLLIMYGTHDDNVHPINEEKFLDALVQSGKTAEVMVFPNRKHDIGDPKALATVFRTMLDFFRRSL